MGSNKEVLDVLRSIVVYTTKHVHEACNIHLDENVQCVDPMDKSTERIYRLQECHLSCIKTNHVLAGRVKLENLATVHLGNKVCQSLGAKTMSTKQKNNCEENKTISHVVHGVIVQC